MFSDARMNVSALMLDPHSVIMLSESVLQISRWCVLIERKSVFTYNVFVVTVFGFAWQFLNWVGSVDKQGHYQAETS